jgi:hypothetical protein
MQGRDLVTKRLAAAGRHDQEDILTIADPFYDLLLRGAELVEAKDGLEGMLDGRGH